MYTSPGYCCYKSICKLIFELLLLVLNECLSQLSNEVLHPFCLEFHCRREELLVFLAKEMVHFLRTKVFFLPPCGLHIVKLIPFSSYFNIIPIETLKPHFSFDNLPIYDFVLSLVENIICFANRI